MSRGSVNPWSTSVTRITLKVRKRIRFRRGKGLPSASTSGSESAAAKAMTPRIPVHPVTKIQLAGGTLSFWPKSRLRMK